MTSLKKTVKVLQDNKEKTPWNFEFYDFCHAQEITHLKTGDYTLADYPDLVVIERKASTGEIAGNFGIKWSAFQKELERMRDSFLLKYAVFEFYYDDVLDFPRRSGIPKNKWKDLRITGNYLLKKINELAKYDVEVVFAGTRENAEQETARILKESLLYLDDN